MAIYGMLSAAFKTTEKVLALPAKAGTSKWIMQKAKLPHYESFAGSLIRGAAGPLLKSAAMFGVSSTLGEMSDKAAEQHPMLSAVAGVGSFWAGTVGFRQALRTPLRGARAKWGYRRDTLGSAARSTSRLFDKYAYAPERFIGGILGGGLKGFGKSMIGQNDTGVPLLLKPIHGAMGVAKAGLFGTVDRIRNAGRAISNARKFGGYAPAGTRVPYHDLKMLPGVSGRLLHTKHPYFGALAIGGAYGSTKMAAGFHREGEAQWYPDPRGGINPRNYGGGMTFMNSRSRVQSRMGSNNLSQRMSRGRM